MGRARYQLRGAHAHPSRWPGAAAILEGSPADRQLADWLAHRPSAEVLRAGRLIAAMLAAGSGAAHNLLGRRPW